MNGVAVNFRTLPVVAFLIAFFSYMIGWWRGYRKAIAEWEAELPE